ncbi:YraN family protein, partial [bacterium DOLZORAL124_64_63]
MTAQTQRFGRKNEKLALDYLKRQGYRILTRNYRTPMGEVDIIAEDGQTIVFVEVKARRTDRFGHPKVAVTPAKQRHLSMAALTYLKETRNSGARARFDVVAIRYTGDMPTVEHI